MKKIITIGVFFTFFAWMQANGQTATSNCSQVIVTQIPNPPTPPLGQPIVIPDGMGFCVGNFPASCCRITPDLFEARRFFLEVKDNNGNWSQVSTNPQYSTTFSNLNHGTYRVLIEFPTIDYAFCGAVPTEVYDIFTSQLLGHLGTYINTPPSTHLIYTNEVVVGAPVQSDNQWSFLDGNGIVLSSILFDPNEQIRIDATACKHFDKYDVAIQEFWPDGTPHRWRSKSGNLGINGLISHAQIPLGVEDIRLVFNPSTTDPNWQFIPGNTYRVQVAISNSTCTSWIDNLQTFFLCYPTWGCREGIDQAKVEPVISPNPVSRSFKIEGIEFNPVSNVKDALVIHDLTGRLVKNFKTIQNNEFDVSDLSTGVYFVSVLRDNHKLFTKKLMVSR